MESINLPYDSGSGVEVTQAAVEADLLEERKGRDYKCAND